jgi:hypothetical protein
MADCTPKPAKRAKTTADDLSEAAAPVDHANSTCPTTTTVASTRRCLTLREGAAAVSAGIEGSGEHDLTAHEIWPSSAVLIRALLGPAAANGGLDIKAEHLVGKRVLDAGSGTGVVGLVQTFLCPFIARRSRAFGSREGAGASLPMMLWTTRVACATRFFFFFCG